jgi:hypothetical protein
MLWERRRPMAVLLELITGRKGLETIKDIIDDVFSNPKDRKGVFNRDDKTNEFLGFAGSYENPKDLQMVDDILAFSFKSDGIPTHLVEEYVIELLKTHREVWWSAHRPNKRVVASYTAFVNRLEKEGYRVGIGSTRDFKLWWRAVRFNLVYFCVKAK